MKVGSRSDRSAVRKTSIHLLAIDCAAVTTTSREIGMLCSVSQHSIKVERW